MSGNQGWRKEKHMNDTPSGSPEKPEETENPSRTRRTSMRRERQKSKEQFMHVLPSSIAHKRSTAMSRM